MNPLTWSPQKKKKLYIIFFNLVLIPTKINMNTLTLNFWLSSIEISLNMILSFYVVLVFINVQSSSLISALLISKFKKSFIIYSNSKKVTACIFINPYTSKVKIYYQSIIFLSFTVTPSPIPNHVTILLLFFFQVKRLECSTILIYSVFF